VDRDEYRRTSLASWDRMASGWERRSAEVEQVLAPVREWLVRELQPEKGQTILELAAGAGDTGFAVASALGDSGRLISTDISPVMVDVARRRGSELGYRNLEFRTIDAENLELEDASVDGVICRLGYMLMADAGRALTETRRVLRPGGRLVLAVWGVAEQNPWSTARTGMLIAHGFLAPPEPGGPGPFRLGSEVLLGSALAAAGFASVRTEEVPVLFRHPDLDHYVATSMDCVSSFAVAFRESSEEGRSAMTQELADSLAPFAVDGGYEIPGVARTAVAS